MHSLTANKGLIFNDSLHKGTHLIYWTQWTESGCVSGPLFCKLNEETQSSAKYCQGRKVFPLSVERKISSPSGSGP